MRKGRNIYKRKDGRWEARYPKEISESGKIKYGSCYGKTYKEALQKQKEKLLLSSKCPSKKTHSSFSVTDWCDRWLEYKKITIKESSYDKYSVCVEKHIKPFFEGIPFSKLTQHQINQFSLHLIEQKRLSSSSARGILQILRMVIDYAQMDQIDPTHFVFAFPKEQKKRVEALNAVEYQALVSYLLEHLDACTLGILLALQTGLRIGEVSALKWKSIDLLRSQIKVEHSLIRLKEKDQEKTSKTKLVITKPKSKSSLRVVPIGQELKLILEHYYNVDPNSFVLTNKDEFMDPRTLQNRLKKIGQQCGIEHLHFHQLRHTFASRCIQHGFDVKALSEILGHTSTKITMDTYVHSSFEIKLHYMQDLTLF